MILSEHLLPVPRSPFPHSDAGTSSTTGKDATREQGGKPGSEKTREALKPERWPKTHRRYTSSRSSKSSSIATTEREGMSKGGEKVERKAMKEATSESRLGLRGYGEGIGTFVEWRES